MNRVHLEIALGTLLLLATSAVLVVWGLNEESRMTAFAQGQQGQAIEVGAVLFETYCDDCHGAQGLGTPGLCPPLNDRYFFDQRLKDVGWSGTQVDYIVATASGGRMASTRPDQYPGNGAPAMPAFSTHFGGPLREDQIRDIAAFIMNWAPTAQEVSAAPTAIPDAAGTDIQQELPEGDAARGGTLANTAGCVSCHVSLPTGPAWASSTDQPPIGERAALRIQEPEYNGQAETPEGYLHESIVNPDVYVVDGYQPIMPKNYGDTLTKQDVADLIAYLLTIE